MFNNQPYQKFADLLEDLRNYTTTAEFSAPELQQQFLSLREFYQQQILSLASPESDNQELLGKVNSYRTEISKQLHLLEIDLMFLRGARQNTTIKTRLQAISDRLQTLISYCHAILTM